MNKICKSWTSRARNNDFQKPLSSLSLKILMNKTCKSWTSRARNNDARHNANGKADLSIPYKSRNATLNGFLTCLLKEKLLKKNGIENETESRTYPPKDN